MAFDSKQISSAPDAIAPDGSEVRILCQVERGSMAHFTLPPRAVARAMAHRTVEEVWFFLSGFGRMWRRLGGREETIAVRSWHVHKHPRWDALSVPVRQLRTAGGDRRDHAAVAGGRRSLRGQWTVAVHGLSAFGLKWSYATVSLRTTKVSRACTRTTSSWRPSSTASPAAPRRARRLDLSMDRRPRQRRSGTRDGAGRGGGRVLLRARGVATPARRRHNSSPRRPRQGRNTPRFPWTACG
jgi:hypothetical protein